MSYLSVSAGMQETDAVGLVAAVAGGALEARVAGVAVDAPVLAVVVEARVGYLLALWGGDWRGGKWDRNRKSICGDWLLQLFHG